MLISYRLQSAPNPPLSMHVYYSLKQLFCFQINTEFWKYFLSLCLFLGTAKLYIIEEKGLKSSLRTLRVLNLDLGFY